MKTHYKLCGKWLLALVLMASVFSLRAQGFGEIRGKVVDHKTKSALDYATLVLKQDGQVKGSTSSDENGNYMFRALLPGEYRIEVSYVGYLKYTVTELMVTANTIKFHNVELHSMDVNSLELGEVLIRGGKTDLIQQDENKKTISSKEILKSPSRGSGAINNTSSGVNSRSNQISFLGNRTGGESYSIINENEFKSVKANPLGTFSIDVDKASYANTRRFLMSGTLPPPDAVRIEEFINYFNYNYPEPDDGQIIGMHTKLGACPWNKNHLLLQIGVKSKSPASTKKVKANLVFLVDVSGSMSSEDKLPLVQRSLVMLLNHLEPTDRVAIVVYAGNSGLVLPSTECIEKYKIETAINNLVSGGSTAGGEGIELAYKIAAQNFIKEGINRVILATDGDFNVGVNSENELEKLISEKKESGVFLTVLGFGTGNYQDSKMQILADKGNGNYAYIDNILEAQKILVNELGQTMKTVAKDVKIQVEFNKKFVKSYRLIGYENRILAAEDFKNDKKDAGEMGEGSTVTAVYEIIPVSNSDNEVDIDTLRFSRESLVENPVVNAELAFLKLRYKEPDGKKSKEIVQPIGIAKNGEFDPQFQFVSAVIEFGMVLRDSEFKGASSLDQVLELAKNGSMGEKDGEYSEFIKLVGLAKELKQ